MNSKTHLIEFGFEEIPTTKLGYDAFLGNKQQILDAINQKIDWVYEGSDPLHGAIYGKNTELIEFILQAGSPVDTYTHYLMCKFMPTVYEKHLTKPAYTKSLDATTATKNLKLACQFGSANLCQHFLNHGANPNDATQDLPAIFSACKQFRKDLVELLLMFKADINIVGRNQASALRSMLASGSHLDNLKRKDMYEFLILKHAMAIPALTTAEQELASQGEQIAIPLDR